MKGITDPLLEIKDYIRKGYVRATALVKAIEQRKTTLLRIAEYVVNYQQDFLRKGAGFMRPLNMKSVGKSLGISESTVSRAVSGKHIQTPAGIFELKFFFSTDLKGTSSVSIKDAISRIVLEEDKLKPLSDKQIQDMLETSGIKVARRTVAKYRQELCILPSSMRKGIPDK
jgi:RNA polymerase sigma-54 factor